MQGDRQEFELGERVTVIREGELTPEDQANMDAEASRKARAEAFIKSALARFDLCDLGEKLQRERSIQEVEFNSGRHWDKDMRQEREDKDRVVLEVNRTPQYLNQVGNEERMSKPGITIIPAGYGSDNDTAKIFQGIIRAEQKKSDADSIRSDAFYRLLEKGWSCYRVSDEWESPKSFKRVIRTREIANDFAVFDDPSAVLKGRTDSNFRYVIEDIPLAEYKEKYPESELASITDPQSLGLTSGDWYKGGMVRIAEYMYKVREKAKVYALPGDDETDPFNYNTKYEDELTASDRAVLVKGPDGKPIVRDSYREKTYWAKINAVEVLEGNDDLTGGRETLSDTFPVIYMTARKMYIDGKYVYAGMVRDAMEPCLASDYWLSAITEMVALGPKSPWIVASKAIDNYKEMWNNANIENYSALYWDHVDEKGQPIPAPFRSFGEPPIQAMTFILRFADEDLKRVMGIYNAGLGAPGPETSGVAINNRKVESDVANYHYTDDEKHAITQEARIYIDLVPKVYDQAQAVEIVRPDNKTVKVVINKMFERNGEKVMYDLKKGRYDVEITIGQSFDSQRREAAANMTEFLKYDPGAAPFIGDLIVRQQNYADKDEFEQRLKARVPPEALGADEDGSKVPPKFMAQYQQTTKMVDELTKAVQTLQGEVDSKERQYQHEREMKAMELASAEAQNAMRMQTQLAGFATKADLDEFKLVFQKVMAEADMEVSENEEMKKAGSSSAPVAAT